MDCGPKLQGQRSCTCAVFNVGNRCNSGRRSARFGRSYIHNDEDDFELLNFQMAHSNTPRWRELWRKIKRQKRRIFSSTATMRVAYDPYTYSQNFDHGSAWLEPDNLSRSFSARFADPSRIFRMMD